MVNREFTSHEGKEHMTGRICKVALSIHFSEQHGPVQTACWNGFEPPPDPRLGIAAPKATSGNNQTVKQAGCWQPSALACGSHFLQWQSMLGCRAPPWHIDVFVAEGWLGTDLCFEILCFSHSQ